MNPRRRRPRVALRALAEYDLAAVALWHSAAKKLLDRMNEVQLDIALGLLAITFRAEDGAIGVMEYHLGVPENGWLGFRFVAAEPCLRGLGLDSEAVRLVEDGAVKRGLARCFWASVHHDDGLGLYFWLRLGYRLSPPGEFAWPDSARQDIISMVRVPRGRS